MHFLNHKIKILLHLMVGHMDWNQYKHVMPSLKAAKCRVQAALKPGGGGEGSSNIGIVIRSLFSFSFFLIEGIAYDFPDSGGYGGNTTTAEACRKVYRSTELRERLVNLCPDLYKEAFRQLLFNDLIILRLTSCKYRVLVDKIGKRS